MPLKSVLTNISVSAQSTARASARMTSFFQKTTAIATIGGMTDIQSILLSKSKRIDLAPGERSLTWLTRRETAGLAVIRAVRVLLTSWFRTASFLINSSVPYCVRCYQGLDKHCHFLRSKKLLYALAKQRAHCFSPTRFSLQVRFSLARHFQATRKQVIALR